jgi:mRNA deadenylase 3'-5' endonuclease subunit Ccr4
MAQSFRIASYNVLADSYVRPDWYPNVEPEVLRCARRRFALVERVARLDANIICLHEVEADAYALFELSLGAQGYEGVYAKKGCGKPDGCAMFFRQGGPRFTGSGTVYYHDGLRGDPDSGHLALVSSFEFGWGVIRVATTHLKWDREDKSPEEHLGYRQIGELICDHFKPDQTAYAWIVCGDMNAQPDSPVVKEFVDSGFIDAYAGHEQATCNPNRRAKRIDYIFHTAGLRAKPARLMEIDDLTPLPSSDEPSDHLAIVATFEKV